MITIDLDSLREYIRFTVEHHGTQTQGKDYRYDQVADRLTHSFNELLTAYERAKGQETIETTVPIIKIGIE